MHAGHQELVVAGVLHNALAAFGSLRLVHIVVGTDFGMVLLQGITVHQVTDYEQVPELYGPAYARRHPSRAPHAGVHR